uniref:Mannosyltransferase n=1 Tax=Anopheles minimus TaxID=112268 RepID=A0A182VXH3_9DIPT
MSALKSNMFVVLTLVAVRVQSALWSIISDCDETFNYWEPLHYVLKGSGFQTWEYSPEFGLRSYSYLWLHALPAKIVGLVVDNGVVIFYSVRCLLAVVCALLEYRLYKVLGRKCGGGVCNLWLFFQLVNAGMYISSTALLPSSFAMYITLATIAAWLNEDTRTGVAVTALSGLIGWPFAVIVAVPFVLEQLFWRKQFVPFVKNALFFGCLFGVPIVLIDSIYFGKFTVAALNIIHYNVFTSHGPDLYGVEPVMFYAKNLFLNHNITMMLSLAYPIVVIVAGALGVRNTKNRLSPMRGLWVMSPLYLWLLVFVVQPHKEERFIFPVYPFFSLGTALLLDQTFSHLKRYYGAAKSSIPNRLMGFAVLGVALSLGITRMMANSMYYSAPMTILNGLPAANGQEMNVCYGKEWYRFPGSFFLPPNYRARFVESSFTGILPAYYQETHNGTQIVHDYFNDQNKGHPHMLFELNECDFLVDLDTGVFYDEQNKEPNYSADRKMWSIVDSIEFVLAARSESFARAYYVPSFSYSYLVYGRYNLLQRINIMSNYRPRGAIAKVFFDRIHNDDVIQQIDMTTWYTMGKLPRKYGGLYHHLNGPDELTLEWLERSKKTSGRFWLQLCHEVAKLFLNMFMTQTDINGFLKRGSMFILSEMQFDEFLTAGGFFQHRERQSALNVCDIGAGDGEVTLRLVHTLQQKRSWQVTTYATESSWTMRNRLNEKNFIVLETLNQIHQADLIVCFNVLDRCFDPHVMLSDIYESLDQSGFALIALVLPYSHYVEKNSSHLPLRTLLEPWPPEKRLTVEEELEMFFDVLQSVGFKIRTWTKAPYLCEGDLRQSFYWLTDYVVLCSK